MGKGFLYFYELGFFPLSLEEKNSRGVPPR